MFICWYTQNNSPSWLWSNATLPGFGLMRYASLIFISNDKRAHRNSLCHIIQRKSKILFKILQVCGSLFCLFHLRSLSVWTKLLLHWLWLNRQLFFSDMTLHHWVRCNLCFKGTQRLDKASKVQKDEPLKPWRWKLLSKFLCNCRNWLPSPQIHGCENLTTQVAT